MEKMLGDLENLEALSEDGSSADVLSFALQPRNGHLHQASPPTRICSTLYRTNCYLYHLHLQPTPVTCPLCHAMNL
jgi:hypothetical protein